MSKEARGGPPTRRGSARAVRLDLLVFREGLRTEEAYPVHWYRRHRDHVLVTIDPEPAGPLQLVQRAVAAKKAGIREARRGRGRPYDQIWCVFDRDEHPHFAEAVELAVAHDIRVAVSNPCIELWFILHFEECAAFIDRRAAQRRAADLLGCHKVLSQEAMDRLAAHHQDAVKRARALDAKHHGDGSPPGANPSSSVWRLIETIRTGRVVTD